MRAHAALAIAVLVAACSGMPAESSSPEVTELSPIPTGTTVAPHDPTVGPTPAPTSSSAATPSPAATSVPSPTSTAEGNPSAAPDSRLVEAAIAYARRAGFDLAADPAPTIGYETPSFDVLRLARVALKLAGKGTARVDVFLDEDGSIRVAERDERSGDQLGAMSHAQALATAERAFRDAGVDVPPGTLHVAWHRAGYPWYITLDRTVAGHPVANSPMWWWILGDRAYVELAAGGDLVSLYAIRPEHRAVPSNVLDPDSLNRGLARVAERSPARLAALEPDFLWIRGSDDKDRLSTKELSLEYCATERLPLSWQTWCVDPVTGERSATGGAVTDVGPSS